MFFIKKGLVVMGMLMATSGMMAKSELPVDATIRKGVLKNGMTYYIRHNAQTPGVAEFYIAQRVGSILEEPQQRGLAHFLEHMAFNGTKHFPGTDKKPGIVKWCESVGIKFGANLNAYTSVDETVYNISSVPTKRNGVVDSCLLILHDWSHYLLLTDEEIDKERGVIHEEWRTRTASMATMRFMEHVQPHIYAGSKYADCMPIGSMDVVDNFKYDALRSYYQKWYRPDLQAIIVVGDIDVDKMEKKIKKKFSSIPMPKNAAERTYYTVPMNDKMIVYTEQDKEQPTVNFTFYQKHATTPRSERNSEEYYAGDYMAKIIRMMLNDRYKKIVQQPNPPFLSASGRDGNFFLCNTMDAFTGGGMLKPDSILEGISAIVAEQQRVRQHGFTASELKRAKAEMLRYAQDAYNSREERRNKEFVALCLRNFTDNEPMLSPEQELELVKKLDATITLADINNEARNLISNKNQVATIFASEKDGFKLPSKEAIEKTILDAQAKNYAAYTEEKLPETLISKLPKKGNIVSEKDSKFGYKELTLSNGMKVYVKSTKYEPDAISMRMFSEGGTSIYPDSDMVNLSYLISGVTAGGVGKFNNIQLDQMLAGKTASARPYIEGLEEGINGTSNKASLKTMLELTYLYFTSPRRDDAAFKSLMNRQYTFLANRDASPNVAYKDSITAILYGNNPRLAPVKQASLKHVNYDRIMQIYKERFADASDFRVVFTGDIDLDQLRPLLCQYLASLPSAGKKEQYVDRHEYMLRANEKHIFKKEQKTPSSLSNIFISVPMEYTAENDLKLSVLSQLLRIDYTEKVREEKGGTYGVSVSGSMSKDPREEAIMRINFRTDPAKYDELIPIIYQCLDDMAKNGPTQENLNKIKEYERKTYGQMKVINNYYDYLIYNYLTDGIDFDTDYVKKVDSLTIESIRDFAKRIFSPGNHVEITMQPEK